MLNNCRKKNLFIKVRKKSEPNKHPVIFSATKIRFNLSRFNYELSSVKAWITRLFSSKWLHCKKFDQVNFKVEVLSKYEYLNLCICRTSLTRSYGWHNQLAINYLYQIYLKYWETKTPYLTVLKFKHQHENAPILC